MQPEGIIKKEINWHKKNHGKSGEGDIYETGFIDGLIHARKTILKFERVEKSEDSQ